MQFYLSSRLQKKKKKNPGRIDYSVLDGDKNLSAENRIKTLLIHYRFIIKEPFYFCQLNPLGAVNGSPHLSFGLTRSARYRFLILLCYLVKTATRSIAILPRFTKAQLSISPGMTGTEACLNSREPILFDGVL